MKRVILTGGSGFVGANLARRLLRDGHEIHLLARPGYCSWRIEEIRPHVHVHEINLGDTQALALRVSAIRPDWVFHLAAHGAYSWQTDVQAIVATNVAGTVNLVQACLKTGFEIFVNTGSSAEYGWKDHAPAETELLEPTSCYAVTKASATLFCRHTARATKTLIPTLRLYSIYGPFEEPNRLIPALVAHGLDGAYPPLVNPAVARDYVYSEDAIDAYLLAATRPHAEPGAVYNVGSGVQTTLRQVVEAAARLFRYRCEPLWGSMPNRAWDTTVWVGDNRKIQRELGWQPRFSFEQGLAATVSWFREAPWVHHFYRDQLAKAS